MERERERERESIRTATDGDLKTGENDFVQSLATYWNFKTTEDEERPEKKTTYPCR